MSNQIYANRQVVVFIKQPPGNYLVLKKNRPEKFPFCLFTETKNSIATTPMVTKPDRVVVYDKG